MHCAIFSYDVMTIVLFIDRAVAMGRLTVAYGLGMIVGPTLGGWVTIFFNEQYAAGWFNIIINNIDY